MSSLHKALCLTIVSVLLMFWWSHARAATTKPDSGNVIRFQLCSNNVKSIGLFEQSGFGKLWHFVVTLNDEGTRQFRELEEKHRGEPVEIVWAGVNFGDRRLDIVKLSTVHNLMLVSRWQTYRKAQAKMSLLHSRLLSKSESGAACGAKLGRDGKKSALI